MSASEVNLPSIVGITDVRYTVDDLSFAINLFDQWGLDLLERDEAGARFSTVQGSRVVLVAKEAEADGKTAFAPGFRGVTWGVRAPEDLAAVRGRLERFGPVQVSDDGRLVTAFDPFGYEIRFHVWDLPPLAPPSTLVNHPGLKLRISEPAPAYSRARPMRIGHVVFEVADVEALRRAETFYIDGLGFSASDKYTDTAAFLRCAPQQDHHNVALLDVRQNKSRFQHVAFEMRDIHEVFSGGLYFSERGWDTEIGPGRHKFSSAYFWYFKNPLGGQLEYFADMDFLDETWQMREQPADPSTIAEWALPRGAPRFKSMADLKGRN